MIAPRCAAFVAALLVTSAALEAQPRRQARAPQPPTVSRFPGLGPSELLDRRRELGLTARQVARLDSLERTQLAARRTARDRMRALRDSSCGAQQRCTQEQLEALRPRALALRSQLVDTAGRRLAMSVLDSTQRGRVQGMMLARGRARGGMRAGPGMRGRERSAELRGGPRMMGPRGGAGFDGPRARRGRMDPRLDDRRDRPMPPRRPRGELDAPIEP